MSVENKGPCPPSTAADGGLGRSIGRGCLILLHLLDTAVAELNTDQALHRNQFRSHVPRLRPRDNQEVARELAVGATFQLPLPPGTALELLRRVKPPVRPPSV